MAGVRDTLTLDVSDPVLDTGLAVAPSPPPTPSPPPPADPTIASPPPPADLGDGEGDNLTLEDEDQGWIAAPVILGLLLFFPVCICFYAHCKYPGKELTWFKLKTTHSNMAIPFLYMNKEVRDAMQADLRASVKTPLSEQEAEIDKAAETMAEDTLAPGGVEPEITLDLEAGAEQP